MTYVCSTVHSNSMKGERRVCGIDGFITFTFNEVSVSFLGADDMENSSPPSDKILEKRSSRSHEKSFSPVWATRAEKSHVIARKNFSPGWKDDWQTWEDVNCQNNKGYREILSWVYLRFQFQPGQNNFMWSGLFSTRSVGLKFSRVINPLETSSLGDSHTKECFKNKKITLITNTASTT